MAFAIAVSFACSYACEHVPGIKDFSSGTRLTILAIGISALFAVIMPRADEEDKKLEELEELGETDGEVRSEN